MTELFYHSVSSPVFLTRSGSGNIAGIPGHVFVLNINHCLIKDQAEDVEKLDFLVSLANVLIFIPALWLE